MVPLAETGRIYPKWSAAGSLSARPAVWTIARQEIRRNMRDLWWIMAALWCLGYGAVYVANLFNRAQDLGDAIHTPEDLDYFLSFLRWGALAVAAVMAGPAFADDVRRGALDLYLTRSVGYVEYLSGKVLAVLLASFVLFLIPGLLYILASYAIFETHPEGWHTMVLGVIGYGALWCLMGTGVGLGLASLTRSSRAATIILFGGFFLLDILVSQLLAGITADARMAIISPGAAMGAQSQWLLGASTDYAFPLEWGIMELIGLTLLGWAIVAWRRPRVRGEGPAGD